MLRSGKGRDLVRTHSRKGVETGKALRPTTPFKKQLTTTLHPNIQCWVGSVVEEEKNTADRRGRKKNTADPAQH